MGKLLKLVPGNDRVYQTRQRHPVERLEGEIIKHSSSEYGISLIFIAEMVILMKIEHIEMLLDKFRLVSNLKVKFGF